jgi:hypothetical protein
LDFKEEAAKLERFWFKTSNIFIELLLLGFAKPRGSLKSVLAKCTSGPTLEYILRMYSIVPSHGEVL